MTFARRRAISYEEFVAPALFAASAMNGAIYETTGNVFFKLQYAKTFDGVLATPLRSRDVAVGETIYACSCEAACTRWSSCS